MRLTIILLMISVLTFGQEITTYSGKALTYGGKAVTYSHWVNMIIKSHRSINNHIPADTYDNYYRPVLYEILSPDYVDNETSGYYYNTFGPKGLNRIVADFFLLFFQDGNTPDGNYNSKTGATLRHNIGKTIYNAANPSVTIFNAINPYYIISSADGFSGLTRLSMGSFKLIRDIPAFDYCINLNALWFNTNKFNSDLTDWEWPLGSGGAFQLSSNRFEGIIPAIPAGATQVVIAQSEYGDIIDIDVDNSVFNIASTSYAISMNHIPTSTIDAFIAKMKIFYQSNAPTANCSLLLNGFRMGCLTGVVTEEDWSENADLIALKSYYVAQGKALTVNYNSDRYSFDERVAVFSFDDGTTTDLTVTKPLFDSFGLKCTFYINGYSIESEDHMTWDQVLSLHNDGYDIQCHGYRHYDETTLTEQQLKDNMTLNDTAFVNNGLPSPSHHAYTYYRQNASVRQTVGDYRFSCRGAGDENDGLNNNYYFVWKASIPHRLQNVGVDLTSQSMLNDFKVKTDLSLERKTHLMLSCHSSDFDPEILGEAIEYLIDKGFRIVTMKDYWIEFSDDFVLKTPTNLISEWIDPNAHLEWTDNSGGKAKTQIWVSVDGGEYVIDTTVNAGIIEYNYATTIGHTLNFKIRTIAEENFNGNISNYSNISILDTE